MTDPKYRENMAMMSQQLGVRDAADEFIKLIKSTVK